MEKEDIAECKKNEELLKKQYEEQQIILDSAPLWIFYKDKENRFIRVNKAFADTFKMPKEALESKLAVDLISKEQAEAFWKDDQEVIMSGKPKMGIIEKMKIAGKMMCVRVDKIPYRDAQNNIIGVIGFSNDITENMEVEEKFKQKNEELEQMNRLMIGRELKMIELKEEIKKLKQKYE